MATLYVKTPNGTTKSIDLDTMNIVSSKNSTGYAKLPDGTIISYGAFQNRAEWNTVTYPISYTKYPRVVVGEYSLSARVIIKEVLANSFKVSMVPTNIDNSYYLWLCIGY